MNLDFAGDKWELAGSRWIWQERLIVSRSDGAGSGRITRVIIPSRLHSAQSSAMSAGRNNWPVLMVTPRGRGSRVTTDATPHGYRGTGHPPEPELVPNHRLRSGSRSDDSQRRIAIPWNHCLQPLRPIFMELLQMLQTSARAKVLKKGWLFLIKMAQKSR